MKNQPPQVRPFLFNQDHVINQRHRIAAPKFTDFAQIECFRQLTFWERVKIFFGFNVMVYVGMVTQHRPGFSDIQIACFTTKQANPDDHLRDELKAFMAKQHPEAFTK
jgi:hypothetical protein